MRRVSGPGACCSCCRHAPLALEISTKYLAGVKHAGNLHTPDLTTPIHQRHARVHVLVLKYLRSTERQYISLGRFADEQVVLRHMAKRELGRGHRFHQPIQLIIRCTRVNCWSTI
jgi:hypothetical protein